MAGFRLPGGILHPIKDITAAATNLMDNPDMRLGANIQAFNATFGVNVSPLLDGLYMEFRYTYARLFDYENFFLNAYTLGVLAHYQLIKGMDAGNDWHRGFKWRGLTVGTGLLYSNTILSANLTLDDFNTYGLTARESKVGLEIDVSTFTIPLEIYSSGFMLWFLNVTLGFGIDIAFGKNTTSLDLNTTLSYQSPTTGTKKDLDFIEVNGGGTMRPSLVNPKILAGLGFKFGPVLIDIPVSYYIFIKGSGLNLGVTVGFTL
jgi:hypothetical protein